MHISSSPSGGTDPCTFPTRAFGARHGVDLQLLCPSGTACSKVVATLGPSLSTADKIAEAICAGARVFRQNFSHGNHTSHLALLQTVRQVSESMGIEVAIIGDLCGPKMRVNAFTNVTEMVQLDQGKHVVLQHGQGPCVFAGLPTLETDSFDPAKLIKKGDRILLADGKIELVADDIRGDVVSAVVTRGGQLGSGQGIAVPSRANEILPLTKKDYADVKWMVDNGVDFIAQSFVRNAADIGLLRTAIQKAGGVTPIIAKIERLIAFEQNLEEIIRAADAIMVARGDLGVEMDITKVPAAQLRMILEAQRIGRPVIVATEMLTSMINSPAASRGDIMDIWFAGSLGADGVMLSQESAKGQFPIEAIGTMHKAVTEGRQQFEHRAHELRIHGTERSDQSVPELLAFSAVAASIGKCIDAIILHAESLEAGVLLSKCRPTVPVFAFSHSVEVLRQMNLLWGVIPVSTSVTSVQDAYRIVAEWFLQRFPNMKMFGAIVLQGGSAGNQHPLNKLEIITRERGDWVVNPNTPVQ